MGFRDTELCSSTVDFAGIYEYASAEMEDKPIRACVELKGSDELLIEKSGLALMLAHGAIRLMSLLRNSEQHLVPFMGVVDAASSAILENKPSKEFRVRDYVVTDAHDLVLVSEMSSDPFDSAIAQVNSGIPVLTDQLGSLERQVLMKLMVSKRTMAPWVSYKFKLDSANPLTTIGAWTATLDYAVQQYPLEQVAIPTAAALYVLFQNWAQADCPNVVPRELLNVISLLMTNVIRAEDSLAETDWAPSSSGPE